MKMNINYYMIVSFLFVIFAIVSPVKAHSSYNTNLVFSYNPSFLSYIDDTNVTPSLSVPLYRGVIYEGDLFIKENGNLMSPKNNVPSEQDAPIISQQILTQYGGLPPDAEIAHSYTNYLKKIQSSTGTVLESTPTDTSVFYHRVINNIPVVGQSDKIVICLGKDGELLYLYKIWRTLENTGTIISVISINRAIDKLKTGDLINSPNDVSNITIENATLCFYEKSRTDPSIFLEPVWIFYGNSTSGNPAVFVVYARQFANFTATPTTGKAPLKVSFTDTSDASPNQWLWDFGDGTNSTDQSPMHTYTTTGTYNVSLKAWNDLGSDTLKRTNFVRAGTITPPTVTGISPGAGATKAGTKVTITGTGFTGVTAVKFGNTNATSFTVHNATSITATAPASPQASPISIWAAYATTVDITVTNAAGTSATSSADQFTFGNPKVTGISPKAGVMKGGTKVTITGTGFTGVTAVKFGNTNATSFTVHNATSITATAPAGSAGTVDITVTNTAGQSFASSADQFTFGNPKVTGISPKAGVTKGGTKVTITGTGFTGVTAVKFGSKDATTFTVNSATSITATAPAGSVGIVDVTVITPGGTSPKSSADRFTYQA